MRSTEGQRAGVQDALKVEAILRSPTGVSLRSENGPLPGRGGLIAGQCCRQKEGQVQSPCGWSPHGKGDRSSCRTAQDLVCQTKPFQEAMEVC